MLIVYAEKYTSSGYATLKKLGVHVLAVSEMLMHEDTDLCMRHVYVSASYIIIYMYNNNMELTSNHFHNALLVLVVFSPREYCNNIHQFRYSNTHYHSSVLLL